MIYSIIASRSSSVITGSLATTANQDTKEKVATYYFKQVFRASYKSGLVKEDTELNFYGFGTMNGSDGKPFKTRDGGVMELRQLISMVSDVTYTKLKETIVGDERKELADKLAIAVLKYADLLPLRNTDYVFDVDKFSSLEGKRPHLGD